MGELKDKAISGVKWNAIGRFSTQGVNFIIGLVLARMLAPSDYGVVGMVGIFFAIAQTFIDSGFGSALIRKNDCTDTDYSTAFYFNIVVGLVCCILLCVASPFIANFFNTPILKDLIKVMSINMFIGSFAIVHTSKLTHSVDFKSQSIVNLLTAVLSGISGILMAYSGMGVWSLVCQHLISTTLRVIFLMIVTKWYPKRKYSIESLKYLLGFGGKLLIASLLHTIYSNLTTFIIGKFYTPNDLGFYTRGQSLASFPSTNVASIIQSVTYPILAKMQDDDEYLIQAYRKLISMTSMLIFFGMLLLASLAKPLIMLLLTDKWQGAIIYLQVFCLTYMFDHLCSLNLNILYVKGYSNLALRLEVIKKSISITMIVIAIRMGVIAICIAGAIYTQIAVVINTYYTGKLFNLGYVKQVKDFIKYLFYSLCSVLPAFVITFFDIPYSIQIIMGGVLACGIYYGLLRKDTYFMEFFSLLKKSIIGKSINK